MRHYRFSPVFSVLLSLAYPSAASAQVNWWRVDSESGVSLELSKINLRHFEGARFFTSVGFLGTQNAVSKSVSIVTELPYASYDADNAYWINWYINQGRYNDLPSHSVLANLSFTDQFVVGNPYLGIEVSKPDNQRLYRIGVRLPTVTGTHARASVLATFGAWDRFEAFAPKVLTFSFEAGIRTRPTSNQRVAQFLIGPTFMVPDWSRSTSSLTTGHLSALSHQKPTAASRSAAASMSTKTM